MAIQNQQRKLVAVLAADFVGYSIMRETDEAAGASDSLQQLRKHVLEPLVDKYQGRIFNSTVDGALAGFTNVVDAVECSIEIKMAVSSQNENLPTAEWLGLRIGVSLGEVFAEGDDLCGNAVEIASRLRDLAEPGLNYGAANVHEPTATNLDPVLKDQRDLTAWNINQPMGTFPIRPTGLLTSRQQTPVIKDSAHSLVILPFQNLIGDPEQDDFVDTITGELIIAVSRFRKFRVISRDSSFFYKGRNVNARQVASNLGVRYVLEGSVRVGGGRLRITGQLIEGDGGTLVWADHYDGEPENVSVLQDRIARALVGVIQSTIKTAQLTQGRWTHHEPLCVH